LFSAVATGGQHEKSETCSEVHVKDKTLKQNLKEKKWKRQPEIPKLGKKI
jgi:hypothetical protein